jgi:hypothetical protein
MFAAKTVWTAIIWAVGLGPLGKMVYGNASYPVRQKAAPSRTRL